MIGECVLLLFSNEQTQRFAFMGREKTLHVLEKPSVNIVKAQTSVTCLLRKKNILLSKSNGHTHSLLELHSGMQISGYVLGTSFALRYRMQWDSVVSRHRGIMLKLHKRDWTAALRKRLKAT